MTPWTGTPETETPGPGTSGADRSRRPRPLFSLSGPLREVPDLLMAVIPLALTVLLLMSGFTPILRTLSDPNTTWTGFQYQALINRLTAYTLAELSPGTSAAQLAHLREQAQSSLHNRAEFTAITAVEQIGPARLTRVDAFFELALSETNRRQRLSDLNSAIQEAELLNAQSHEQIHKVQELHAGQLTKLRLVLLLGAALSGLLSAALIWRSLKLWRGEQRALDGQRELLSLASHELRRPLQSLMLATDLLRTAATPEDQLRYLGVVETSAAQLASRADLDHLEAMYERIDLALQPVDLTGLLLEFRGPRTDVQVPPQPLWMSGDPARLRQIIENLHENALRYSSGPVFLSLHPGASGPEIQVLDRGPGVDPDDVERLFLPRQRGHHQEAHGRDAHGTPGRGLGLTIARRLARAHGAELTLRPAEGGGTLAALRLPALSGQTLPVSGPES